MDVLRYRRLGALVLALIAAAGLSAGLLGEPAAPAGAGACQQAGAGAAYSRRIGQALRAKRDVWGDRLLAAPGGPTYLGVRPELKPLLFARGPGGKPLTDSGVYYLPFAQPSGPQGAGSVALHVADGSQVVSQRVGGHSLTVSVGDRGLERYGSCLARLTPARLGAGYLPILDTGYVDADRARYRQESFAATIPETRSLVSFARLTIDARQATKVASVRFTPSVRGLTRTGRRLARGGDTYLAFSSGGHFDGSAVVYRVPRGSTRTIYVAWLNRPSPSSSLRLDETRYQAVRRSVVDYWQARLSAGMRIEVPEQRVVDAERALLIQNLELTWRYSIGNPYEEFSFPESVDVAQVMGEYGFDLVDRSILRTSLTREAAPYPNWKRGEKLLASASYYRLFADQSYVDHATPVLRGYVRALGRQITRSSRALLDRERYSSDIADSVYGFHSQAVVWQGLRAIASVWAETGHGAAAATARRLAARLEVGLRRAVRASATTLPDGSLFVPARLLDGEQPYASLTEARSGSYWNLVMPYALASGFFPPGSPSAEGVLRYMLLHGSRLLGLVRAGGYALYGPSAVYPTSGTDAVYGINAARFLADNDQADQLVLSLYGELGAAMTPGTFVSGEGATVAPLGGESYRAMYLPPNSASNAAFLETLRLLLVHETVDSAGEARGLQLAYATPRAWLRPGQRIVVRGAPTSFGPVSFSIESRAHDARVSVEVPGRAQPQTLSLRLRLPKGYRIARVVLDGRSFGRFDPATATIDLSGKTGSLELVVGFSKQSP